MDLILVWCCSGMHLPPDNIENDRLRAQKPRGMPYQDESPPASQNTSPRSNANQRKYNAQVKSMKKVIFYQTNEHDAFLHHVCLLFRSLVKAL